MGKTRPASERNGAERSGAQLLRAPEQKVAREQLGDRDPALKPARPCGRRSLGRSWRELRLKGLAEEPVLDLGPKPVEGGSPAQRGLQALSSVMEAVADHIKTRAAHGCVYELGLSSSSSRAAAPSERTVADAEALLAPAGPGEAGPGPSSVAQQRVQRAAPVDPVGGGVWGVLGASLDEWAFLVAGGGCLPQIALAPHAVCICGCSTLTLHVLQTPPPATQPFQNQPPN
jgi:hypothetical protein